MEPKIPQKPPIDLNTRTGFMSSNGVREFYTKEGRLERREYPDGSVEGFDWDGNTLGRYKLDEEGKRIDVPFDAPEITTIGAVATPEPAPETLKTPEQIDLENRARRIFSEKIRLLEEAEKAFEEGDLERADELCGESLMPLGVAILEFIGPENEKNVPPDIMDLQKRYSELSYSLEYKLSHIQLAPKPAPQQETERERTLASLRATIARNEIIIADAIRELEEIERRIAEAKKKETQEKTPKSEIFTVDFIKDQVKKLLESKDAIKKIYSLEVKGEEEKIILSMKVKAHKPYMPFTNTDVDAKATLQSRDGVVLVTNYDIQATSFQEDVKALFEEKLSEVSEMIKREIEKIKNKQVDIIEIINGELKVTYK